MSKLFENVPEITREKMSPYWFTKTGFWFRRVRRRPEHNGGRPENRKIHRPCFDTTPKFWPVALQSAATDGCPLGYDLSGLCAPGIFCVAARPVDDSAAASPNQLAVPLRSWRTVTARPARLSPLRAGHRFATSAPASLTLQSLHDPLVLPSQHFSQVPRRRPMNVSRCGPACIQSRWLSCGRKFFSKTRWPFPNH